MKEKPTNLLPCPFCGETPEVKVGELGKIWSFDCPPHSSCRGTGLIIACLFEDLNTAKAQWNVRTDKGTL